MNSVINFIKRAFVGEQTTGRESYQRYNEPVYEGVNGSAGFTILGKLDAMQPAGITPGPTHKLNDPSVTGNDNRDVYLQPLTDNRNI